MAWLGSIFFGYIIFVFRSVERPIVCTMLYETKRRIILQNSSVYRKGTKCFMCEDCTISQPNTHRKAYEERRKIKIKEGSKDSEMHEANVFDK